MHRLCIALLLLLAGVSVSASAQSCPVDHPRSRDLAERFLTLPGYAQDRQAVGTVGYSPGDLRVLGAADTQVCDRIRQTITAQPGWEWTAYQVGNKYFVAMRRITPPGGYRLGFSPLTVLDRSFKILGAFGM